MDTRDILLEDSVSYYLLLTKTVFQTFMSLKVVSKEAIPKIRCNDIVIADIIKIETFHNKKKSLIL